VKIYDPRNQSMSGNSFIFNGPIQGRIVNVGSTLSNVTQVVNDLNDASVDDREELARLITELKETLTHTSNTQIEQSEALVTRTEDTITKLDQKHPAALLGLSVKSLREAGNWFLETLPKVPQTIDAIAKIVERIG